MIEIAEQRAAITGVGQSEVGRRLGRTPLELTLDSALAAIDDAGLRPSDIDGVCTWPGAHSPTPGMSGVSIDELQDALRLELEWYAGGPEMAQLGGVFNAVLAVASGRARHVLVYRTVWESTAAQRTGRKASVLGSSGRGGGVAGPLQWLLPAGAVSAANWVGMFATAHFHRYGTTREQLAAVALNARSNAQRNPKAVYRDPLTLDDYMASRMISTPLCLYDCDVPVDASTSVIVSARDAAADGRWPPLVVEAIGAARRGRPSWLDFDDLTTMSCRDASAAMWARTDLGPDDVDVAQVYDGFTPLTLFWLEALGFCAPGEGGPFVAEPGRIALDGSLPLNTNGGQLSAGRTHGYGYVHEAALQLWGRGGDRQVAGDPRVAVIGVGGGPTGGCMVVRHER